MNSSREHLAILYLFQTRASTWRLRYPTSMHTERLKFYKVCDQASFWLPKMKLRCTETGRL